MPKGEVEKSFGVYMNKLQHIERRRRYTSVKAVFETGNSEKMFPLYPLKMTVILLSTYMEEKAAKIKVGRCP